MVDSVCGAKAHEPGMEPADVPLQEIVRRRQRRDGHHVCHNCTNIRWVRRDALARNQNHPDRPVRAPIDLAPEQARPFLAFLARHYDNVVEGRLLSIVPGSDELVLHLDTRAVRDVAFTPVATLVAQLNELLRIHRIDRVVLRRTN